MDQVPGAIQIDPREPISSLFQQPLPQAAASGGGVPWKWILGSVLLAGVAAGAVYYFTRPAEPEDEWLS